jgi:periplasmic divalent cation tolerance protein
MASLADLVRVAFSTAPDADTGARIAQTLVEERLAACVNVIPGIRSIYRWQGQIEDDREVLLVIKTCAERIDALAERLSALHPYQLPELLTLPVAGGLAPYLEWVLGEARP